MLHQRSAVEAADTCVVVAQAFEEEMNRCRYMLNLLAQAIAPQGMGMVLVDPWGTGDSEGDFTEVDWPAIREDVTLAAHHAIGELGYGRVVLLGVRLGAIVALEVAVAVQAQGRAAAGVALWQPVLSGRRAITHLFRIRIASSVGREEKALTVKEYEALSAAGESIEVAGYLYTPRLIAGIGGASLDAAIADVTAPIGWITAVAGEAVPPPIPEVNAVEKWRGEGKSIDFRAVVGPPYWQSPADRTLAPEVVGATADWLAAYSR